MNNYDPPAPTEYRTEDTPYALMCMGGLALMILLMLPVAFRRRRRGGDRRA